MSAILNLGSVSGSGDVTASGTLTSGRLLLGGGTTVATASADWEQSGTVFRPVVTDVGAIGDTTHMVSDLFLASGAVINFNNGNTTLTHSAGLLTLNTALTLTTGNVTAGIPVIVKVTAASYTVGTTDPRELYGGIIYVTSAATITIPAVVVGMNFTVITIGAIAVSVDPNGSDKIYLDGTALDDGDKITNLSAAGDIAVFSYYSADGFYASTNAWTDGGA